jgi:hypothetical protein
MKELVFSEMWKERQLDNFEGEIWKPCTESLYYEISNYGRVKTINYIDSAGRNVKSKIRKLQDNGNGYLYFRYKDENKKPCNLYIHRLVAKCFIENENSYKEVNHINLNKKDNSIYNLEWCNRQENLNHFNKNGIKNTNPAESNWGTNLKNTDVKDIYENYSNLDYSDLMKKYNIKRGTLNNIYGDKKWYTVTKHLNKNKILNNKIQFKAVRISDGFTVYCNNKAEFNRLYSVSPSCIIMCINKRIKQCNGWKFESISYDEYISNKFANT